jgi:hypothetical protein
MEGNVDAATLRLTIKEIAEIERKKEKQSELVTAGRKKQK